MLNESQFNLKTLAKLGTAVTLMLAASACSHEQLKDEAQVSSIEETTSDSGFDSPTPDLSAPPTPVPADENDTYNAPVNSPRRHKAKTFKKKGAHHAKTSAKKVAKRRKAQKTMIAAAGSVELPPAPPAPPAPPVGDEFAAELPPPPPELAAEVPTALATSDEDGGHLGTTLIVLGLLGGIAFAAYKVRGSRSSRRLVFN